jgi:hypothetical protein
MYIPRIMASLQDAFEPLIQSPWYTTKKVNNAPSNSDVIGTAYGPCYSSGIVAYGAYNLHRDLISQKLFVITDNDVKEYLLDDGSVVGLEGKGYRIMLK